MEPTRYQRYKDSYKAYREANPEYGKEYYKKHKTNWKSYTTKSNFKRNFGGLREQILERDGYKCISCNLSQAEHSIKYGRRITIDHIDGNRANNIIVNLQTLCLSCHGAKDVKRRPYFVPWNKGKILK
uniref:Putative homing endonuclease n=1 Tax=viral metagenome TaxID=1070528 RepID=A0A6M3IRX9_9ZZZZ